MLKLLGQLSNAAGISGNEHEVRGIILKHIKSYITSHSIDKMGNLICFHKGRGEPVLVTAHMDEIGLMVKHIDEMGHIHFSIVGGITEDTLVSQHVKILLKQGFINGVISYKELHIDVDSKGLPLYTKMYVDTGLSKKDLVKAGVVPGTYIIPVSHFTTLGNDNIVAGKALDDRVGCAILVELAKRLHKHNQSVYYVFTVQEEVGLYGAKTSIYNINPTWAIAVDATCSDDFAHTARGMNKGPAITVKDSEFIANKCLVDAMVGIAKKKRIPYQLEVSDIGTTDALSIAMSKGGIPTAVLSIPVRNIHSTVSVAHMNDISGALTILETLLKRPPRKCIT